MSLTRRSFIKKSSYSAAAVTAFGAGVGLGNNLSGGLWSTKWEVSSHAAQTIEVGPFDTEAQALQALSVKMRDTVFSTNVLDDSGVVDVSGLTEITRFFNWANGAKGAEIQKETVKDGSGKWHARILQPTGFIYVSYFE